MNKENLFKKLEEYGLSDPLESVGQSAKYCDYALISMFPLLLWDAYVQFYYPTSLPWSQALAPLFTFIILIIFRGRLDILAADLETGVRSKDAWLDIKNGINYILIFALVQNFIFFGLLGNNLNKLFAIITLSLGLLSCLHMITMPQDKSEVYLKIPSMRLKFTRKIVKQIAIFADKFR